MKTFVIAAAVLAAASATTAMAAGSSSTEVNAELARSCSITSSSSAITLGAVGEEKAGEFTYACNFTGSPTLTFTSANGGIVGGELEENKDYAIYLNDEDGLSPVADWLKASQATAGVSFTELTETSAPNTATSPVFKVALLDALTVAGTYTDTLTISIAP